MPTPVAFVSGIDNSDAYSLSVTVAAGTNCLIVHSTWSNTGKTVTGITYAGVAMTILGQGAKPTNTGGMVTAILLNPAVGTANVAISFDSNPTQTYLILSASMYSGVFETGVFDMDTDLTNELGTALRDGYVETAIGTYQDTPTRPGGFTQNQSQSTTYSKLYSAYKAFAKDANCDCAWTSSGNTRVHSVLLYPAKAPSGEVAVDLSSGFGFM